MRQKTAALLTSFRNQNRNWKQAARSLPLAPLDANKLYFPKEVASILGVSYNTNLRFMTKMRGVVDMGMPEKMHKRGKKMLRIKGSRLI
jgi:hypothetical protein